MCRYLERLCESLIHNLRLSNKAVGVARELVVRREGAETQALILEPKLKVVCERTKQLQAQVWASNWRLRYSYVRSCSGPVGRLYYGNIILYYITVGFSSAVKRAIETATIIPIYSTRYNPPDLYYTIITICFARTDCQWYLQALQEQSGQYYGRNQPIITIMIVTWHLVRHVYGLQGIILCVHKIFVQKQVSH